MPATAVAMLPPVVRWQQLLQRREQIVVAARAGFDDRDAGGGVWHEHVQQSALALGPDKRRTVSSDVKDEVAGAGVVHPRIAAHTRSFHRPREYRPGMVRHLDESLEQRRKAARIACQRVLFGHGEIKPAEVLAALARAEVGDAYDRYGEGGVLAELEAEVAQVLGADAAVFMPSGIMAQQCVLRVWAERGGSARLAVHGLSHLVVHELGALPALHGLTLEHLTDEERQPTPVDLAAIPGRLGAVTLELPLRDAGHLLPTWDELTAFSNACGDRDLPLHLDGARLWESAPHLGRSLADIVHLADSVYVSFYKGLGALAGAAVAGSGDVVAEARRWQRRHGGNLLTLLPYAVSAREGLRRHLPRMTEYHEGAVALAAALREAGMRIQPDPPHSNAFRMYAPVPHDEVNECVLAHLETAREAVSAYWDSASVPGWSVAEFTVGAATCDTGVADVAARLSTVVLGDRGT